MLVGTSSTRSAELTRRAGAVGDGAEAAPDHLRGRYLSLMQLAWTICGTVAPVAFAWLLERGVAPIWLAMLGVSVVCVLISWRRGPVLPAGRRAGHQPRRTRPPQARLRRLRHRDGQAR